MEDLRCTCLCGRVELALELPTRFVSHCHCHNCRRAHGAAFVTWAGFPEAQVRFVRGEDEVVRYDTDVRSQRTFCGSCGSTLLFSGERWAGEVHVAVGNIEGELEQGALCEMRGEPHGIPFTIELFRLIDQNHGC